MIETVAGGVVVVGEDLGVADLDAHTHIYSGRGRPSG